MESGGAGGQGREPDDNPDENVGAQPYRERVSSSLGSHWEINFSEIELLGRVGVGGFGEVQRGKWQVT